jgi:hypothetical protein
MLRPYFSHYITHNMKRFYTLIAILLASIGWSMAANSSWVWTRQAGTMNTEEVQGIGTDNSGNIYVTGSYLHLPLILGSDTLSNNGLYDIFLIKYNSAGVIQWAKRAGGSNADWSSGIQVNGNGEIFLTGNFFSNTITFDNTTLINSSSNGSSDIFAVKFDSNGNVIWAKKAGGPGEDRSKGIAADANGNVFVTGYFNSQIFNFGNSPVSNITNDSSDVFIIKYDQTGNESWALNAGGNDNVIATSIAVDAASNIVICGYFKSQDVSFGNAVLTNTSSDSSDIFVTKIDNNGNVLWAKKGGGNRNDFASSLTTDNKNNVYVTGNYSSPTINFGNLGMSNAGIANMFLVKYDKDGDEKWSVNSEGVHLQEGNAVCTDRNGYVYVGGGFHADNVAFGTTIANNRNPGSSTSDNFVIKYDNDGNLQWLNTSGGNSDDETYSICADINGDIIAAGFFNSPTMTAGTDVINNTGNADVFVSKICNASAKVNTATAAVICDGEDLTLTSDAGGSYLWNTGATTRSISINIPGNYSVQVTNSYGCSMNSIAKAVTTATKPIVTYDETNDSVIITGSAFTLTAGTPVGGVYTGDGVAGNIFDPSIVSIGNHEVFYTYTDSNGCSNTDTALISIQRDPGNPNVPENNLFTAYPVQVSDFTTLKFNNSLGNARVYVFNAAGEKVMDVKYNGQPVVLDFRRYPASPYFIFVRTIDRTQTKKIIRE